MDLIYVFIDGPKWEDLIIFLSKEEAKAKSIKYPTVRVEIFAKSTNGYIPTYNYYLNGNYVRTI
jgi:hypothetical protein